ncbi:phage tail sheath family protein [Enterococcus olivae]
MAGGTFTAQNKIRPGAYINVTANGTPRTAETLAGVAALPLALDFGPENTVVEVDATSDLTMFGYDLGNPKMLLLREALKRASSVLLYRVGTGTKAKVTEEDITITAAYAGSRGNKISVVSKADINETGSFEVETYLEGRRVDVQKAKTIGELQANAIVTFSGSGDLTAFTATLSDGTDNEPTAQDYMEFFNAIQVFDFNTLALPVEEEATKTAGAAFIKRLRDEEGKKCQLVVAGLAADSEAVINVKNGVILADGTEITPAQATAWVAGASAAAGMDVSLTHTPYDNAIDVKPRFLSTEIEDALRKGEFVFTEDQGRAIVEQDINSYTSFTDQKPYDFSKNAILRILDGICNNTKQTFNEFYIGSVRNTEAGRDKFKADRVNYALGLERAGLIEGFNPETDVTINRAIERDSVEMYLAVQPTDAMEKLYLTLEMK